MQLWNPDRPQRAGKPSWRTALATVLLLVGLLSATAATADEYEPEEAGHPLRVVAYVVHPVGVVLDYLIFRPAHWLGSHEPLKTLFGHTD